MLHALFADLSSDVRSAVRQLRKYPGVTAAAVLMLALGIGANTAIFSVVHSVLLQPLPYPAPERLLSVYETRPDGGWNAVAGGTFLDWRESQRSFESLAIFERVERNLTGIGAPQRVRGLQVSDGFLAALGVTPALGRDFAPWRDGRGPDAAGLLVSHRFWQQQMGADPGVLGGVLRLDQEPFTILGVLPPRALLDDDVQFLLAADVGGDPELWRRSGHWRSVVGRLAPAATAAQAAAELRSIRERRAAEYPAFKADWGVAVVPTQEVYARHARPTLLLLLGAVALVLLIACANVSNLMLARGQTRVQEMAIRAALGAHRWRIVRQMLVESLLLAGLGCALGLLVARSAVDALAVLVASEVPRALAPELDASVLGFTAALAVACGLLFGILPALRAARDDGRSGLRGAARGASAPRAERRAQGWLVAVEFALTLVLLVAAGLLLRSFASLLDADPGFAPRGVLAFDLSFPEAKYPETADRLALIEELKAPLRALPGVESVGSSFSLPLGDSDWTDRVRRVDAPAAEAELSIINYVDEGYLATMGMTLVRGRGISAADNDPAAQRVVVVDRLLAARLFGTAEALGGSLVLFGEAWEVVGLVEPVRQMVLDDDPRPTLYVAQAHWPMSTSVVLRTSVPPLSLVDPVRSAVFGVDADQPVANVRTLEQAIEDSLARRRTTIVLLGGFAALAIGLAGLGVYGLMSFTFSRRLREFGIRAALGAQRRDLMRLVFRSGLRTSGAGIALGLLGAAAGARFLEGFLFEVRSHDPWVFGGAVVLLLALAAVSIYLPARRVGNVDPTTPLRSP